MFALIGLQMMHGKFKMMCFNLKSGLTPPFETYDGSDVVPFCNSNAICE